MVGNILTIINYKAKVICHITVFGYNIVTSFYLQLRLNDFMCNDISRDIECAWWWHKLFISALVLYTLHKELTSKGEEQGDKIRKCEDATTKLGSLPNS